MKKTAVAMLVSLFSIAGAAYAQDPAAQEPTSEIRESTDPAKAAEVEQRAMEIKSRQQSDEQMRTSGASDDDKKTPPKSHPPSKPSKSTVPDATSGGSSDSGAEADMESSNQ
ncbi:MAG TPA: hypothetical protein VM571_10015 [Noviherbaspirillum sp.]|nr:hypothetical protein [Noviherbaspirillum sp.]